MTSSGRRTARRAAMAYALSAGAGASQVMPFPLSACETDSYCLSASEVGSWSRWTICAVPVYSQYMSMSPEVSAWRAASLPSSPVSSRTSAPPALSASTVIWPSTSCSVNSLEPTVSRALEVVGADGRPRRRSAAARAATRGAGPVIVAAPRDQGSEHDEHHQRLHPSFLVVAPPDRSRRAIRRGSLVAAPPATVISTSPFSNSALIWLSFVSGGNVMARRNAP